MVMDKKEILEKYLEYVLTHGAKPSSIFVFAKELGLTESQFYTYFASFDSLEQAFWKMSFDSTKATLESDATYLSYSSKDKLLAFYFGWIQLLRNYRSYVVSLKCSKTDALLPDNAGLQSIRKDLLDFALQLIQDGIAEGQVVERKYISDKYNYVVWFQSVFILNYWLKDHSDNFEMTDAAIEKTVNLIYKLLGENTLDSLLDFGKFMAQSQR